MRVLRIVTLGSATGKYGGPFDTAVSQARLLGNLANFRTTVLTGHLPDDMPSVSAESFEFIGRRVHRYGMRTGFSGCISWPFLRELLRQVRQADLVHVSYARELVPIMAASIAILFRKPLVIQPHGMMTARTSRLHRLIDAIALPIYKRADRVIALTDVEASRLESWSSTADAEKMVVLGNPLPYAVGEPIATSASESVLFVARLEPRKRVVDFVEARRIAHANGWSEVYEVVGPDQGDGEAVRSAAASTPGLNYRGAVPASALDAILSTAGVFVLTSENEPWGNVLVAALVRGVPVVVTQSAALAEEIRLNHLGLVVPDRAPEAVAGAVHQVLTTSWRTPEETRAAREFAATRFDQTAIRDSLADVYRSAECARMEGSIVP